MSDGCLGQLLIGLGQAMEKKAVLGVLLLLASLQVSFTVTVDGTCCDWWMESVEWPVEASECPAISDGTNNATYCCGLCYASDHYSFEESRLVLEECPTEDDEDKRLVPSLSSSIGPSLALIIPGVLFFLFCAWLWSNEDCGIFPRLPGPSVRSRLRSRLRSRAFLNRDLQTNVLDTVEHRQSPSVSGITNVQFYQSQEEDDTSLPPVVFLPDPEEPASGGTPEDPVAPVVEAK